MAEKAAPAVPEEGTSHGMPVSGDELERRWDRVWEAFFAGSLLVPTVVASLGSTSAGDRALVVGVAGALGLWHWFHTRRRPEWAESPRRLVWYAGALVALVVLLRADAAFFILLYGLLPQVFVQLGRYAIPGAVGTFLAVFAATADAAESLGQWLLSFGLSAGLAVLIGSFINAIARQSELRQEAVRALEATRTELAVASRRAGVLEERARIARELHDTVAQGFTGIVMQLEAADSAFERAPDLARDHVARARASARQSLAEMRRAVRDLRPELLDELGLSEALTRTVAAWSRASGIPATFRVEGPPTSLSPDAEVALLRAAQEALANVAKHARASAVRVVLDYTEAEVSLRVRDDGVGIGTGASDGDGIGLLGMRERLTGLGGRLDVGPAPDGGTLVAATVGLR